MSTVKSSTAGEHRARVLAAAMKLLAEGGQEAVSTRAVAVEAHTQPPTIYRLFGDKQGLLDALAAHGWAEHFKDESAMSPSGDPVEDLRTGWQLNIAFALANPALFSLMYGSGQPSRVESPAALAAREHLMSYLRRIAQAGRLGVTVERAARLVQAAGSGVALALISAPEDQRDMGMSDLAREAVIRAIVTDAPTQGVEGPASAAVTLRALLPQVSALSPAERGLLDVWLERIADQP
jgi:AcrR family transcriptional regulator